MQANLYTNFAINQENKMEIIKLKLDSNLVVSCLKSPFRRIRLRSFPLFLMIVKELQYLLLDKGVYARNYSNGAFCKPRGIWWLGRNKFIRFVASTTSCERGGGFGKGGDIISLC